MSVWRAPTPQRRPPARIVALPFNTILNFGPYSANHTHLPTVRSILHRKERAMPYRDETGDSFWNDLGGQRPVPVPAGGRLLAQHWRCPSCQKIIYAWDKTVPCDKHRVVTDWQRHYQSEDFITAAAAARERAHPAPPADREDFPGGLPLPPEYPRPLCWQG